MYNAFGQTTKADQFNGWIFYTGNHKLTEKWGLHTEFQFRRSDGFSSPISLKAAITSLTFLFNASCCCFNGL